MQTRMLVVMLYICITVYNFIVLLTKHNSVKQGTSTSITRNLNIINNIVIAAKGLGRLPQWGPDEDLRIQAFCTI